MKTRIELNGKTILITGAAGFIGAALTQRILREGRGARVIGLDNMNDYYDPRLKEYRCAENERARAEGQSSYQFVRGSIADKALVDYIEKIRSAKKTEITDDDALIRFSEKQKKTKSYGG